VLLKGHITDKNSSNIIVYEPINGFSNREIAKPEFQIHLNKSGYFEKKLSIDFPVTITIRIGMTPILLVVEPKDTIDVDINTLKVSETSCRDGIKITGRNGKGNLFYNKFEYHPTKKNALFEKILDSLNFRKTFDLNSVAFALSEIVHPFDSLFSQGDITKTFHDIVVNDIKGDLLTRIIKFDFFEKPFGLDSQLTFAQRLYIRFPVTSQMLKSGLHQSTVAYYYYYSKARKYFSNYLLNDSTLSVNGKIIFINEDLVPWLFAPKDIQEFEWANNLVSLKRLFATVYGKRDVDAFLTLFPDSRMKEFLAPPYFPLTVDPVTRNDSTAFIFLNSDNLNSFDSVLSHFKGKRLFVDFWATWCVPCKLEFSYNEQLDTFCVKNNIQRLYVAFEMGDTRKNLRKAVYAYNLKGTHIVANKKLIEDIISRFYPGGDTYTIPRYLLVNKMGEIVNKKAARPSSGNQLFAEMKSDFKLK
jgi:thiol-disulfide isomerase/thioredoxin